MAGWRLGSVTGAPGELHGREVHPDARGVTVCRPASAALVLGSTQREHTIDRVRAAAAGLEVVRRRSGGGAVVVRPGHLLWIEVGVPAGDPLWHDDVGVSFYWLGDVWARALALVGLAGAVVHHGRPVRTPLSDRLCFAGLGSGEVTVRGRKVVGLSQRRSRAGALFHCAALLRWDAADSAAVLALTDRERQSAAVTLAAGAAGAGDLLDAPGARLHDELAENVIRLLP